MYARINEHLINTKIRDKYFSYYMQNINLFVFYVAFLAMHSGRDKLQKRVVLFI